MGWIHKTYLHSACCCLLCVFSRLLYLSLGKLNFGHKDMCMNVIYLSPLNNDHTVTAETETIFTVAGFVMFSQPDANTVIVCMSVLIAV